MVADDIVTRLRGEYLNDVTVLLDEMKRLRAEADSTDKKAYDSLRVLYDRQLVELKKHKAEVEYLRAENKRLKESRFDLQAADHIVEAVRDVLYSARRLTDMHRLASEEKKVSDEYEESRGG